MTSVTCLWRAPRCLRRDLKGWNPAAIAVFHESKATLRLLLRNGSDPFLKSSYNKSAWDMAQDEVDAAEKVVKSRCSYFSFYHIIQRVRVACLNHFYVCGFDPYRGTAHEPVESHTLAVVEDFTDLQSRCCTDRQGAKLRAFTSGVVTNTVGSTVFFMEDKSFCVAEICVSLAENGFKLLPDVRMLVRLRTTMGCIWLQELKYEA